MYHSMKLKNHYNRSLLTRISSFLTAVALSLSVMVTNAYATTSAAGGADLFAAGETMLADLKTKLVAISGALAAVVVVIAVIFWFVCNDNQKVRTMKDWAFRAFWGFIIINIIPSILKTIQDFLSSQGLTG